MKKIIESTEAPAPVGPYSQAVKSGGLLFTSGQIPIDPKTGDLVPGGIREQAIQVLENIKALLEAVDSTLENVVKTTVFMVDLKDFSEVNTIYAEYFGEETAPARSTIQVAGLPKGSLIEIELVAKV